jgi:broad specificity polyphosphatase/5'/3'-nucleotidase SurE
MDEGTDYWAIKRGFISVTPLQMDMTNKTLLEVLKLTADS